MIVICTQCNIKFNKPKCHAERVKNIFCSKECHDKFQIRNRITKFCKICGEEFKVRLCESKRFSTCSKKCQRISRSKENNPRWNGGTTLHKSDREKVEYKEWRKLVFERDNYTCCHCNKRGGTLNAHHKKSWRNYPDLRYEVDNGKTLCLECHKLTYKEVWKENIL